MVVKSEAFVRLCGRSVRVHELMLSLSPARLCARSAGVGLRNPRERAAQPAVNRGIALLRGWMEIPNQVMALVGLSWGRVLVPSPLPHDSPASLRHRGAAGIDEGGTTGRERMQSNFLYPITVSLATRFPLFHQFSP
jgi:hypothetical protein